MHAPSRKIVFPSKETYFPFGRSQSRNFLQDFYPSYLPDVTGAYSDTPISNIQIPEVLPPQQVPSLLPEGQKVIEFSSSQTTFVTKSSNNSAGQAPAKGSSVKRSRDPENSVFHKRTKKLSGIPSSKKTTPSVQQPPTSVLLLRCSDLHEIMLTVASVFEVTPTSSLNFYVNNDCPLNGARNVLILKIIFNPKFDCFGDHDLQYLWDVWFNLSWSQTTAFRFREDLQDLLNVGVNDYLHISCSGKALSSFRTVWNDWLTSINNGALFDPNRRRHIHIQRKLDICQGFDPEFNLGLCLDTHVKEWMVKKKSEEVIMEMDRVISLDPITHSKEQEFTAFQYCRSWIMDGHTNDTDYYHQEDCLNPTLLEQGGFKWIVHHKVNPLTNFLPIVWEFHHYRNRKTCDSKVGKDLFSIGTRKILASHLNTLQKNKEQVSFHFFNEDPVELCFMDIVPTCHVVHGYDLAEQVQLANLLIAARRKLVPTLSSILLTKIPSWKFTPQIFLPYFLDTLGVPISVVPTLYGLELMAKRVSLSNQQPTPDQTFSWSWAPAFHNIRLDRSPFLERSISHFADKCLTSMGEYSPYTPQTLSYLVTGLARRSNNPYWSSFVSYCPNFKLAWKTLDHWHKGLPVSVCHVKLDEYVGDPVFQQRVYRFILSPLPYYSLEAVKKDNCHYFDNFDLGIEGGRIKFISFLLTDDHGLGQQGLYGYLVDAVLGLNLVSLGQLFPHSITNLKLLFPHCERHPYSRDFVPPVEQLPPERLIPCLMETKEEYLLDVSSDYNAIFPRPEVPTEVKVFSTHKLILNLKGLGWKEVTLTFPHRFDKTIEHPKILKRYILRIS